MFREWVVLQLATEKNAVAWFCKALALNATRWRTECEVFISKSSGCMGPNYQCFFNLKAYARMKLWMEQSVDVSMNLCHGMMLQGVEKVQTVEHYNELCTTLFGDSYTSMLEKVTREDEKKVKKEKKADVRKERAEKAVGNSTTTLMEIQRILKNVSNPSPLAQKETKETYLSPFTPTESPFTICPMLPNSRIKSLSRISPSPHRSLFAPRTPTTFPDHVPSQQH